MILPIQFSTETAVEVDGLDATGQNPECVKHTRHCDSAVSGDRAH